MIKYLGSKRTLLPLIVDAVRADARARSVLDLFSGTARVGHALKLAGYRVVSNDHNAYAHTLSRCYVEADYDDVVRDADAAGADDQHDGSGRHAGGHAMQSNGTPSRAARCRQRRGG